jgi:hypothetical protein
MPYQLQLNSGPFAVARLEAGAPIPPWTTGSSLVSITRTEHELSIVCEQRCVPSGVLAEPDWVCLAVRGPLDFSLVGILADLSTTLARAGVSIFVISTYDTDYLLLKATELHRALHALRQAGHSVTTTPPGAPEVA